MFPIEKSPKISAKFICEKCDYKCSKQSEYNKHMLTNKHKILHNPTLNPTSEISEKIYECNCGKIYKHSSTLYTHKKKCTSTNDIENNETTDNNETDNNNHEIKELKELMKYLMKENSELKTMMFEVIKNGTHNNTTNSHNKSFNLQFFLNETCKDAMNIMDFVNSLKIELSDLENVGKVGYVNGMSSIIVKNLNLLDETKRPVHCTDTKREVMYVKDENKWEKEDENKKNIRKLIKHVTHKNTKLFKEFKQKYPGCEQSDSKYSDTYDKLIVEAFGGKGDDDVEKENRIIRNIAKNVTIEKE